MVFSLDYDILKQNLRCLFGYKPTKLIVQYNICNVKIDLNKNNDRGITSSTFYKLLTPEFAVANNRDESGLKITTLIDKKTGGPVPAYVAKFEQQDPNAEGYGVMVEDNSGDFKFNNKKYKIVGTIYFYIDKQKQMVSPKFEMTFVKGELYEKVCSYMKSNGNNDYAGIGTRLHQIRIERMLQNNLGNSYIVAEGDSFPFHYSMGYRLMPATRPAEESIQILQEFYAMNKKTFKYNLQHVFAEFQKDNYVINWSASLENFLCDYYKNGGKPLDYLTPNMFLTETSVKQWIAMIKRQPILY